jgi:hypothetical protein
MLILAYASLPAGLLKPACPSSQVRTKTKSFR